MDGMGGGKGAVGKIDLDTFFQLAKEVAKEVATFHAFLEPSVHHGLLLGRREDFHGISHLHAGGRAKYRTPFHPSAAQARRGVHQGIAHHGGLAKNCTAHLIG